jgi:hypothetical protein
VAGRRCRLEVNECALAVTLAALPVANNTPAQSLVLDKVARLEQSHHQNLVVRRQAAADPKPRGSGHWRFSRS